MRDINDIISQISNNLAVLMKRVKYLETQSNTKVIIRNETGDPTTGINGQICINKVDDNAKIFINDAWFDLTNITTTVVDDGTETPVSAETLQTIGNLIASASTFVIDDTDSVPIIDKTASNILGRITWGGIKSLLESYFDLAYADISHVSNTSNPHGVTKDQVGLSNVDNTSDANKPVSSATQTALNLKANLSGPTFTDTVTLPSTTSIGNVSSTELGYLDGVTSAIQTQLNAKVPTTRTISTTAPLDGGGDLSADRTLTISAATTSAAGSMSATDKTLLDNATATPTASRIAISDANGKLTGWIDAASETLAGKVELATAAETTSGASSILAVHPAGLKVELDKKVAGPASATDNAIVRFDGTTGKLVQNSLVTINDNTSKVTLPGTAPELRLTTNGSTTSYLTISETATSVGIKKYGATATVLDLDTIPNDEVSAATIRLFRSTNTSGLAALTIAPANNTSSVNTSLSGNKNSFLNVLTGNVGIGTTTPSAKLHVAGDALITSDLDAGNGVLFVDQSQTNVGINTREPDQQFALDVNGPARAQYWIGPHALQLKDAAMICHFDGGAPYETNYTGELTGHMGQVGTATGGVIHRPGKFGKGVQIAEGTDNLVVNPSFETDVATWAKSLGTETTSNTTTYGYVGSRCLTVVCPATTDAGVVLLVTANTSALTQYTLSAYVRGQGLARLWAHGGDNHYGNTVTLTNDWQRLTLTFTYGSAAARYIGILNPTAATTAIDIDAVQVEAKAYVTPYCDGSLGTGHVWNGVAHAATSTRAAATLSYDPALIMPSNKKLTVMCWAYFDNLNTAMGVIHSVGGTGSCVMYPLGSDGSFRVNYGTAVADSAAGVILPNTWHHLAMTADGTSVIGYVDGVAVSSSTQGTVSGVTLFGVGHYNNASNWLDGILDDFAILHNALTAIEIRAIYESNAPVFAESSMWSFRSAKSGLVWADEEGLWMRDTAGNSAFGISGVQSKSWGGTTLNSGDLLIGNSTKYVKWTSLPTPILEIAGKVTALEGYIGTGASGFYIGGTYIGNGKSTLTDANAGVYVGTDGIALGASSVFKVTSAGALTATSATISGAITATSGTIGGFTVNSTDGLYSGTGVTRVQMKPGAGFWAGDDAQASAPFRVTQAGVLTATSATITGAITASSGTIGSFTIGTYLYTGSKTAYNDANAGIHLGSDGIGIGNNVFTVSSAGALVATSATVTGTINASAGYLASLDVTGKLTMSGASSAIAIGATPPTNASTGTGLWIDRTGYYGLSGGDYQVKIDATNGKLYAGGGKVILSSNGLDIIVNEADSYSAASSVSFLAAGGVSGGASAGTLLGSISTKEFVATSYNTVKSVWEALDTANDLVSTITMTTSKYGASEKQTILLEAGYPFSVATGGLSSLSIHSDYNTIANTKIQAQSPTVIVNSQSYPLELYTKNVRGYIYVPITKYAVYTNQTNLGVGYIDLNAAGVPVEAIAVQCGLFYKSATVGNQGELGPSSTDTNRVRAYVYAANTFNSSTGVVSASVNGSNHAQIYFNTNNTTNYVYLDIHGYYI